MSVESVESTLNQNENFFPSSLSEFKDVLEKTDDNGILQIYSYKQCVNESLETLKNCRGLVFNNETQLFKSLGYTPEYSLNDKDFLNSLEFSNIKFFPAEEGTLIRVFYFDKWYISTHRKLDAFRSKWGSQTSFGEIFRDSLLNVFPQFTVDNVIENFTQTLNKSNVYFFLVRNTLQNRIVCNPPNSATVYHVGTFVENSYSFTENCGVPKQEQLELKCYEDLVSYVSQVNPKNRQGVIGFFNDGKQFKVINDTYKLFTQVRGNEASVPFRYLQVRTNPVYVHLMHELYPEYVNKFSDYENAIFRIAKNIHTAYINRFVNKQHAVVSQEEYRIVRDCHGWHISDRQHNKVTLNVVLNVLSSEKYFSTLNTLVKRFIYTNQTQQS
jgi:hypothetical protein